MPSTTITITTTIDLDIPIGAQWFANLDDDQQCKFFVEVARIAKAWPGAQNIQWYNVGSHLKNCTCSSADARSMIETIYDGMQTGTH